MRDGNTSRGIREFGFLKAGPFVDPPVTSGAAYRTGTSLKRQAYCLLKTSASRFFTLPVRSTETFLLPIGTVNDAAKEPSGSIGAKNLRPRLELSQSS